MKFREVSGKLQLLDIIINLGVHVSSDAESTWVRLASAYVGDHTWKLKTHVKIDIGTTHPLFSADGCHFIPLLYSL